MLVQIKLGDDSIFLRAEVPSFDVEDVRAMYLEQLGAGKIHKTARDMFNAMPELMPTDFESILRPLREDEL